MDATLLGQESPPCTYPNPTRYFIFNFLIISFIFIENKCLFEAIWDLKQRKHFSKRRIQTWVNCIKKNASFYIYIYCKYFLLCFNYKKYLRMNILI